MYLFGPSWRICSAILTIFMTSSAIDVSQMRDVEQLVKDQILPTVVTAIQPLPMTMIFGPGLYPDRTTLLRQRASQDVDLLMQFLGNQADLQRSAEDALKAVGPVMSVVTGTCSKTQTAIGSAPPRNSLPLFSNATWLGTFQTRMDASISFLGRVGMDVNGVPSQSFGVTTHVGTPPAYALGLKWFFNGAGSGFDFSVALSGPYLQANLGIHQLRLLYGHPHWSCLSPDLCPSDSWKDAIRLEGFGITLLASEKPQDLTVDNQASKLSQLLMDDNFSQELQTLKSWLSNPMAPSNGWTIEVDDTITIWTSSEGLNTPAATTCTSCGASPYPTFPIVQPMWDATPVIHLLQQGEVVTPLCIGYCIIEDPYNSLRGTAHVGQQELCNALSITMQANTVVTASLIRLVQNSFPPPMVGGMTYAIYRIGTLRISGANITIGVNSGVVDFAATGDPLLPLPSAYGNALLSLAPALPLSRTTLSLKAAPSESLELAVILESTIGSSDGNLQLRNLENGTGLQVTAKWVAINGQSVTEKPLSATVPLALCIANCDKTATQKTFLQLTGNVAISGTKLSGTLIGQPGHQYCPLDLPFVHFEVSALDFNWDIKSPLPTTAVLQGSACLGSASDCSAAGSLRYPAFHGVPTNSWLFVLMPRMTMQSLLYQLPGFGILSQLSLPGVVAVANLHARQTCTESNTSSYCFVLMSATQSSQDVPDPYSGSTITIPAGLAVQADLELGVWDVSSTLYLKENNLTAVGSVLDGALTVDGMPVMQLGSALAPTGVMGAAQLAVAVSQASEPVVEIRGVVNIPSLLASGDVVIHFEGTQPVLTGQLNLLGGAWPVDITVQWTDGTAIALLPDLRFYCDVPALTDVVYRFNNTNAPSVSSPAWAAAIEGTVSVLGFTHSSAAMQFTRDGIQFGFPISQTLYLQGQPIPQDLFISGIGTLRSPLNASNFTITGSWPLQDTVNSQVSAAVEKATEQVRGALLTLQQKMNDAFAQVQMLFNTTLADIVDDDQGIAMAVSDLQYFLSPAFDEVLAKFNPNYTFDVLQNVPLTPTGSWNEFQCPILQQATETCAYLQGLSSKWHVTEDGAGGDVAVDERFLLGAEGPPPDRTPAPPVLTPPSADAGASTTTTTSDTAGGGAPDTPATAAIPTTASTPNRTSFAPVCHSHIVRTIASVECMGPKVGAMNRIRRLRTAMQMYQNAYTSTVNSNRGLSLNGPPLQINSAITGSFSASSATSTTFAQAPNPSSMSLETATPVLPQPLAGPQGGESPQRSECALPLIISTKSIIAPLAGANGETVVSYVTFNGTVMPGEGILDGLNRVLQDTIQQVLNVTLMHQGLVNSDVAKLVEPHQPPVLQRPVDQLMTLSAMDNEIPLHPPAFKSLDSCCREEDSVVVPLRIARYWGPLCGQSFINVTWQPVDCLGTAGEPVTQVLEIRIPLLPLDFSYFSSDMVMALNNQSLSPQESGPLQAPHVEMVGISNTLRFSDAVVETHSNYQLVQRSWVARPTTLPCASTDPAGDAIIANLSAHLLQRIAIVDATPPHFVSPGTCLLDVVLPYGSLVSINVTGTPVAEDIVSTDAQRLGWPTAVTLSYNDTVLDLPDEVVQKTLGVYLYHRLWTATDAAGNIATWQQNFWVRMKAPVNVTFDYAIYGITLGEFPAIQKQYVKAVAYIFDVDIDSVTILATYDLSSLNSSHFQQLVAGVVAHTLVIVPIMLPEDLPETITSNLTKAGINGDIIGEVKVTGAHYTDTPTSTATPTVTPSASCTASASSSITGTPSRSPSRTSSLSATPSGTPTPSRTDTGTSSLTGIRTDTSSLTMTPTPSPSITASPTRTSSATQSPIRTNTMTLTPSRTSTRTLSQTFTPTGSSTRSGTLSGTMTATRSRTSSATSTSSSSKTGTPSPSCPDNKLSVVLASSRMLMAGHIEVVYDGTYLQVMYTVLPGWTIEQVHTYAGISPPAANLDPKEYTSVLTDVNAMQATALLLVAAISGFECGGPQLYIMAHALVQGPFGETDAWGTTGNSTASPFNYQVLCACPSVCDTSAEWGPWSTECNVPCGDGALVRYKSATGGACPPFVEYEKCTVPTPCGACSDNDQHLPLQSRGNTVAALDLLWNGFTFKVNIQPLLSYQVTDISMYAGQNPIPSEYTAASAFYKDTAQVKGITVRKATGQSSAFETFRQWGSDIAPSCYSVTANISTLDLNVQVYVLLQNSSNAEDTTVAGANTTFQIQCHCDPQAGDLTGWQYETAGSGSWVTWAIIIVLILVVVGAAGGCYWHRRRRYLAMQDNPQDAEGALASQPRSSGSPTTFAGSSSMHSASVAPQEDDEGTLVTVTLL